MLNFVDTSVHWSGFLQNLLWRNAELNTFHSLPELANYPPRYDPTVTPVQQPSWTDSSEAKEIPAPVKKLSSETTGYYTSVDYHQRYLAGEISPTDVVEALLPLIQRGSDGKPSGKFSVGFLETRADLVRAAAAESTKRYKEGKPLGPLDGVPVAVKDEVHLKGYGRCLGSKLDFKRGIDETSWCVRKWEEAGAIIIGKTNMHEVGIGMTFSTIFTRKKKKDMMVDADFTDTNNNNPNYGTPLNPHNPNYYCGGSSGGSGYALAAGLVPIALGADGGGSIRIPSSFCGVYGLKTTHGRVSGAPTPSIAPSVGVLGPMAVSVDDLALAYRLMAAPVPAELDGTSARFPDPRTEIGAKPRPKTIGLVRSWIARAEPSVRERFDAAVQQYVERKGYKTVDIEIPFLTQGQRAHALTILAELASGLEGTDPGKWLPHTRLLVSVSGSHSTGLDYVAAQKLRGLLMSHLADLFRTYSRSDDGGSDLLIVTPTTPLPGWEISGGQCDLTHGISDARKTTRNMEFAWLANFVGCPAVNIPVGYDPKSSVPIGLMAMGEWGAEEALLGFAYDGEEILGELKRPSREDGAWVDVIDLVRKK